MARGKIGELVVDLRAETSAFRRDFQRAAQETKKFQNSMAGMAKSVRSYAASFLTFTLAKRSLTALTKGILEAERASKGFGNVLAADHPDSVTSAVNHTKQAWDEFVASVASQESYIGGVLKASATGVARALEAAAGGGSVAATQRALEENERRLAQLRATPAIGNRREYLDSLTLESDAMQNLFSGLNNTQRSYVRLRHEQEELLKIMLRKLDAQERQRQGTADLAKWNETAAAWVKTLGENEKGATRAAEQHEKMRRQLTEALELERAELVMGSEQFALHKLMIMGATEAQLAFKTETLGMVRAFREQEEALEDLIPKIEELNKAIRDGVSGDIVDPTTGRTARRREEWLEEAHRMADSGDLFKMPNQYADEWSGALDRIRFDFQRTFADLLTGEIKNFNEFFREIARQLQQTFADIAAKRVGDMIFGGSDGGGGLIGLIAGLFHKGGTVGRGGTPALVDPSIFTNAPRFHRGLAADEFPAILQRGEQVIPRGGPAPETAPMIVNLTYSPSISMVDARSGAEFIRTQRGEIVEAVVDAVRNSLQLRRALAGT